jgi:hypothetical protein
MEQSISEKHYSNELVRGEIAKYCRGRWIAIEGGALSSRVFLRYGRDDRPLSIKSPQDILDLLKEYRRLSPRTIYGSINIYRDLSNKSILEDPSNIIYASPIWDIDGELSDWRGVIEVARIIIDDLERLGISKSVFVKWSGEGAHVHIHERCFSSEILSKHNPLDIAYSIVDYTLNRCREKILDVISRFKSVKVENEIDLKRVFTAPLSLHRRRNLCCICFKPEEIDSFEVEWANPENFKHNSKWKDYAEGEGDWAALEAIKSVGGYKGWLKASDNTHIRTVISAQQENAEETEKRVEADLEFRGGKIGRFQVMGLLQAARYYLLMGDLEKAKSFGLNRAIFYAWAKRHGKEISQRRRLSTIGVRKDDVASIYRVGQPIQVGNEVAFASKEGWFMIGDQIQRPEDYDRQVARQINSVVKYEIAWQAAIEYLKSFEREILLDQQRFFKEVYEPVRDRFLDLILDPKVRFSRIRDLTKWFK